MKAKFTNNFIQSQKNLLLNYKMKILNSTSQQSTAIPTITIDQNIDPGDLAQNIENQDIAIGIQEQNLKKLRDIEIALEKITLGTYGICEESEELITIGRLKRIPWAKYTIEVAEELERDHNLFYHAA